MRLTLYTTKNLQGSVTLEIVDNAVQELYTTKNLQGSVTHGILLPKKPCYILLKIYRVL